MSGVFHNDIDQYDDKELLSLEDDEHEYHDSAFDGKFEYPSPLYKVKLEYSSEGIYATAKPELNLQAGDYVIIPTRYGKDLARVLGISKEPIGIKPSEIVDVERKANNDDLIKYESFKEKEEKAEEKEPVFDEDQKEALDRCGFDSEDPIVQKAFAEGMGNMGSGEGSGGGVMSDIIGLGIGLARFCAFDQKRRHHLHCKDSAAVAFV